MFPASPVSQRRHREGADSEQRETDDRGVHPEGDHVIVGVALIAQREDVPAGMFRMSLPVLPVIVLLVTYPAGLLVVEPSGQDSKEQEDRNHKRGEDPELDPPGFYTMPRCWVHVLFPHNVACSMSSTRQPKPCYFCAS